MPRPPRSPVRAALSLSGLRLGRPARILGRADRARIEAPRAPTLVAETIASLRDIAATALAPSTRVAYKSHVAFFAKFLALLGLDFPAFGLPVAQGGLDEESEETVMAAFAVHGP